MMEIHCKHDPFAAMHSKSSYCLLLEIGFMNRLWKHSFLMGYSSLNGDWGRPVIFIKQSDKTLWDLGVCLTGMSYLLLCIDSFTFAQDQSPILANLAIFRVVFVVSGCRRLLIVWTLCRRRSPDGCHATNIATGSLTKDELDPKATRQTAVLKCNSASAWIKLMIGEEQID